MKLLKPLAICSGVIAVILGGGFVLKANGIDVPMTVTQARCQAGAFMNHSAKFASDADGSADAPGSAVSSDGLSPVSTAQITGPNLIPNASLEELAGSTPDAWHTTTSGGSKAGFSVVPGRESQRGVRVDVTNYKNGSADWYYNAVDVTPGAYYSFQDDYRSNVPTRPILELHSSKSGIRFVNLTNSPVSGEWSHYGTTFYVPMDVTQVIVFHPLAAEGWLETDNLQLQLAKSKGFDAPRVSLTFDDGWKSIYTDAIPLLEKYHMVSTQYLISGYLGQAKDYVDVAEVYNMRAHGNEIASHTVDHLDLTKLTQREVTFQLARSKANLSKCFGNVTDFAAPYGTYNKATIATVSSYYGTARSTDLGYNTADSLDAYHLKVQNMDATTTPAQLQDWLATAKQNNAWLILVYHQIDSSASPYARSKTNFELDLKHIQASGIQVQTVSNAYAHIKGNITK